MKDFDKDRIRLDETLTDGQLPPELEDKIAGALRDKGAFIVKPRVTFPVYIKAAAIIVLFVSVFGAGWLMRDKKDLIMPVNDKQGQKEFVLLLFTDGDFKDGDHLDEEYATWFRENTDNGLQYGQELANDSWVIDNNQIASIEPGKTNNLLSGFFVISASGADDALRIAGTCPHLKYGGYIELRPVVQ